MSMMKKKGKCSAHGGVVCECGTVITRCKCKGPVTILQIDCIHRMTVDQLLAELKAHAISNIEEDPTRMVWALKRIADAKRCKLDVVFREIREAKKEATGNSRLPGEALRASAYN